MVTSISLKKYGGYIRVSGDKQAGEGHSPLEAQVRVPTCQHLHARDN